MKKIFNILFLTLAVISFASCTGEVDDIFDKSSAQRVAEKIDEYKNVLTSAKNGWVLTMKADPQETNSFGAYNLLIKFNQNDSVDVSSELDGGKSIISSHFKIYQSQGINLSFDEHNKYIHYFSDPVNEEGFGYTGEGLEGDFEFLITKISSDEIILKGKKTEVEMRMIPVDTTKTWKEELDSLTYVDAQMANFIAYGLTFDDSKESVLLIRSFHTFSYTDKDGNENIIPFTIKKDGLHFLNAETIYGHRINGFKFEDGQVSFTSTNNNNVKLTGIQLPLLKTFEVIDKCHLKLSAMSPAAANAFYSGASNLNYYLSLDVSNVNLHFDEETGELIFNVIAGGFSGKIYLEYEHEEDDTIKLNFINGNYDGNGSYFYNYGFKNFINNLNGTFKLIPDNEVAPKSITFVDTNNPRFYFEVDSWPVQDPINK